MLPPFLDAHDLDDAAVLIVDDVADTGRTLELVHDFCAGHVAEARTAVLYEKPQSVIKADFAWRYTDRWINFPWSTLPPVTRRVAGISGRDFEVVANMKSSHLHRPPAPRPSCSSSIGPTRRPGARRGPGPDRRLRRQPHRLEVPARVGRASQPPRSPRSRPTRTAPAWSTPSATASPGLRSATGSGSTCRPRAARPGTAQEYTTLPSERVVRLPDGISFDIGASLGVPAMTAHRALTVAEDGAAPSPSRRARRGRPGRRWGRRGRPRGHPAGPLGRRHGDHHRLRSGEGRLWPRRPGPTTWSTTASRTLPRPSPNSPRTGST